MSFELKPWAGSHASNTDILSQLMIFANIFGRIKEC
jgi:hypothetical protein